MTPTDRRQQLMRRQHMAAMAREIERTYTFIVICRDDSEYGAPPGPYVLATRRVFATRTEAEHYASGVATGREAIVVEGRWHQLRIPLELKLQPPEHW